MNWPPDYDPNDAIVRQELDGDDAYDEAALEELSTDRSPEENLNELKRRLSYEEIYKLR